MNEKRVQRDRIDGVLLIDKPVGLSSNDALMRARRLLNARKAGHGGTLDPMASGLLPLAFGEATKFASDALDADKLYLAEVTLGVTTDTADTEGQVVRRAPVQVDEAALQAAAASLVGEIEQVPPMHSALKRDGRPLYEYARAGVEVERAPRCVTVHSIELVALEPVPGAVAGGPGSLCARLRVSCSKGTYVRTLAEDIGTRLGCGAHLSALRRLRVGALRVEDAIGLDALEAMNAHERLARLAPVDFLLAGLRRTELDDAHARRFLHGQRLRVAAGAPGRDGAAAQRVRVYCRGALLGVATLDNGLLVPARLVGGPTPAGAALELTQDTGIGQ